MTAAVRGERAKGAQPQQQEGGKYKPFTAGMKKDSVYNKFMMKPDSQCSDRDIRIKYDMAADVGDWDNLRHIPAERGFAQIGKGQY